MNRYSFKNDYSEGAHPNILNALSRTNIDQEEGYGEDRFCIEAAQLIRDRINNPKADIHFVAGGTLANLIIISSILKPYESIISAGTGHICVHETGAIEATGHKINSVETDEGKLSPDKIRPVLEFHADEHMVKPKMVYISNSTELGSIYNKSELKELSLFCRKHHLILYLDGARLGSALTSRQNDMALPELSEWVDILYIGGTKNGALLGEVVIINNDRLKEDFRFHIKQKGALLAKGRILGIQFVELFKEDLFFKLGRYANKLATKLADSIDQMGYAHWLKPVSNQIFPIFPNPIIDKLSKKYGFYVWKEDKNDTSVIRLITSWATKEEAIEAFLRDLSRMG